jgi:hypothetical protein
MPAAIDLLSIVTFPEGFGLSPDMAVVTSAVSTKKDKIDRENHRRLNM